MNATVYERHRLWSADGTLLQQVQAAADAAGEIDWDISVDSTIVPCPSARGRCPDRTTVGTCVKGGRDGRTSGETPWQSLLARLVEVVQEVRDWAARGAGSPANST